MINLIGNRRAFFFISAAIMLVSVLSLAAFRLNPGVEFTSGSTMTVSFENPVDQGALRDEMAALGHPEAIIQRTGEGNYFIRTRELEPEQKDAAGAAVKPAERVLVEQGLIAKFGNLKILDFYSVSPLVASEIGRTAAIAIVLSAIGILLYIAWAFRKMPKSFRWGVCATIALVHNVIITMGVFAILGKVTGIEVDSMFIVAILTIVGYSINDTVVVFDRIRENVKKGVSRSFEETINVSVVETLGRSVNTNLTTMLVVVALFLLGGPTIHSFLLALIVGIAAGTYSSIFVASPLLLVWDKSEWGSFLNPFSRKTEGAEAR